MTTATIRNLAQQLISEMKQQGISYKGQLMTTTATIHNLAQQLISEMEQQVFRNIQATIMGGSKAQKKPTHPLAAELFAQVERRVYERVRKHLVGNTPKIRTVTTPAKTRVKARKLTRVTTRVATVEDNLSINPRDTITFVKGKYEVTVRGQTHRATRKRDLYRYVDTKS